MQENLQQTAEPVVKEPVSIPELANEFAKFQLPEGIETLIKMGMNPLGARNRTKIVLFAGEQKMNNEAIDYYMNMPPARQEGEAYDDYKNRMRFSKLLLKHRTYLYNYEIN